MLQKLKKERSRFEECRKITQSGKFTKNYNGSDRIKTSNSRDRDKQNGQNFHRDKRKVKCSFCVVSK